jgi:hypothetical protein
VRIDRAVGRLDTRYPVERSSASGADPGLRAETCPRWAVSANNTIAAGILYVARISLVPGVYTTVTWNQINTGSGCANSFIGLYDESSLAKVAATADISATFNSTPAAPLTATMNYTCTSYSDFYVGLLIGTIATTAPQVSGPGIGNSFLPELTPPTHSRHNSTGLSALPDPLVLQISPSGVLGLWFRYE